MSDDLSVPQLPLSEKHIKALGLLVARVTLVESILMDLISILSSADIFSTVMMVGHQQLASKIDTLAALCDHWQTLHPLIPKIIEHLDAAKAVNDFRNSVVHTYWAEGEDGLPLSVRYSTRRKFERKRRPISAESIEQHAQKAQHVAAALKVIRDKILADRGQKTL